METTAPIQKVKEIDLPERLASVFRQLRSGKHICRDDISDYRDLERNEDVYRTLFSGLGYELIHHGQGFYFFTGANYLSTQRLQASTIFMLILFQDLEDKKFQDADRAWEHKLLSRIFSVNELPHFQTSQRRNMLFNVGVSQETLVERVLRPMAKYGMLEMVTSDQFQFRSPIYRFVDLCLHFASEAWAPRPEPGDVSRTDVRAPMFPLVPISELLEDDEETEEI